MFGFTGHGFVPQSLTPIQQLVAYFGARLLWFYSSTLGLAFSSGAEIETWADARGPSGFGPTLVLGGSGDAPVLSASPVPNVVFDGGQVLSSPAALALFDTSEPIAIVQALRSTISGFHNFTGLADGMDAARLLSVAVHNAGGYATRGGADVITVDSGQAVSDTEFNVIAASSGGGEVNVDAIAAPRESASDAAPAAGNNFLTIGAYFPGPESTAQDVLFNMGISGELEPADLAAIGTYAVSVGATLFPA